MVTPHDSRAYKPLVLATLFQRVAELTTGVTSALRSVEHLVMSVSTTHVMSLPLGAQTHHVGVIISMDYDGPTPSYLITVTANDNSHAFSSHDMNRIVCAGFSDAPYTPQNVTRVRPNEIAFAITTEAANVQ